MAPAVFNTDVIEYLGQAGSIPVRLRQGRRQAGAPRSDWPRVIIAGHAERLPRGAHSRIAAVPDSPDDIETRVTILEREVVRLRDQVALTSSEAAAARVLAAGADHDVSEVRAELRAHTQALNALRETQLEQGRAIAGLDQRVAGLERKVAGLDQRVTSLDQKIAGLDQRVTSLDQKMTSLDQKMTSLDQKMTSLDQKMTEGFAMLGTGMAQITALLSGNTSSGQD